MYNKVFFPIVVCDERLESVVFTTLVYHTTRYEFVSVLISIRATVSSAGSLVEARNKPSSVSDLQFSPHQRSNGESRLNNPHP